MFFSPLALVAGAVGLLFVTSSLNWLAALTLVLVVGHFSYQNKFKYFYRLGLKNPAPWPVVGNLFSMISEHRFENEKQWAREFGKFYGIFQGTQPRYVVADPELLRQICIKDFDAFPNHDVDALRNKYQKLFTFFLQDDQWRRVRALQTPTFTSGKMKRMYRLLQKCALDLAQCFGEQLETKSEALIQLKDIYSLYTMDGIASCAYGLKMEREKGTTSLKAAATRNEFIADAMAFFEFRYIRLFIVGLVPKKLLALCGFHHTPESAVEPFANKVRKVVEARRKSGKHLDDYLQLLLDAHLDDKLELSAMDNQENHHAGLSESSILAEQQKLVADLDRKGLQQRLSDDDILASAMFLLAVGLETTATLLTHCTYALAHHPEIQEKLYQEIKSIAHTDGAQEQFDYDNITSCAYLDSVISETLRLLSPVIQLDRVAKRDYYVQKYNVTIPKDAKLLLAFYAIMNDPDFWPQPERFDPERFMPANRDKIVPGSYCPFGIGPRHCLGMRFSLTEAKVGLASVLMNFRFEPAPGTQFPPLAKRGIGLGNIKTPQVIVKARC